MFSETPTTEGQGERKKGIQEMNAKEKIEHIRGKIEGYDLRIRAMLDHAVGSDLNDLSSEQRERAEPLLQEAFLQQVESYMVNVMPGGGTLEHFAHGEGGVSIPQELYVRLNETAAAVAAQFADEAGEEAHADKIKSMVGQLVTSRIAKLNPRQRT